jgi:hypothetical protein
MTRADLIALAAQAADAVAAGRLPFGCQGPTEAGSDAAMRWRYDEEAKVLRVHVSPVAWNRTDILDAPDRAIGGNVSGNVAGDIVEGFWIPRPWTASESCPAAQDSPAPAGADPVTLPGQTLAIAQFFDGDGARQGQRNGKPYETVVRMAPDEVRAERGFQLRIDGRIADIPGQGPVSCRQPAGAEQRPICIVAIAMDHVAIDNPVTGKTLATWDVTTARVADR